MRTAVLLLSALLLAACAARLEFEPGANPGEAIEGGGGMRATIDGVEIWLDGSPPRRYSILGRLAFEVRDGDTQQLRSARSAAAGEVKRRGGDAAIELPPNLAETGPRRMPGDFANSVPNRRMQFAVIKYLP